MRTRILSKMLNSEVEEYLGRNDIIFVPVGTTESHGGFPLDSETVLGEAIALRMAEACDGLVLTNLPYFYPGATSVARGTIQMSIRTGIDYLYEIAESLLHQGFRRQIYLTGHGPAHMTISPVIRDFFDKTGVTIMQVDVALFMMTHYAGKFGADMNVFHDVNVAGYQIMGRLEDVPLTSEFSEPLPPVSAQFNDISSLGYQSSAYGYYFANAREHMPTPALPDAKTRKIVADRGEKFIDQMILDMNVPHMVEQLRRVDAYNQDIINKNPWVPAAHKK